MTVFEYILIGMVCTGGSGLILIYVLYPLFAFFLPAKKPVSGLVDRPDAVTLIITAWQEDGLFQKLENSLALRQEGIELEIIVMTDQICPSHVPENVRWVIEPTRMGKAFSINEAVALANYPILIFTDANTRLNEQALLHLLDQFQYADVGAVAGEKRLLSSTRTGAGSERLYWQYESILKRADARMHSVIGGAGELFAMRKELFRSLPTDCILDDLELSWQVVSNRYRIAYAPGAIATELPSSSLKEEMRRKIRIAAGAYQFLDRHPLSSLFAAAPLYGWQFLFRKWARWMLAPIFLLLVLTGAAMLTWLTGDSTGRLIWFGLQAGFYLMGALGWVMTSMRVQVGWMAAPFYFLFMHFCQARGWFRYRFGQQTALWEKSARVPIR